MNIPKILIIAAASLLILMPSELAAHKINNFARLTHSVGVDGPHTQLKAKASSGDRYIPIILKTSDTSTELPDFINVMKRRGELVLATVAESLWDKLYEFDGIERVESSLSAVPQMDLARNYCGYPQIGLSAERPDGLTGEGVVTGLFDTGIDFNHIAFQSADGGLRIKRWIHHDISLPLPIAEEDAAAIRGARTDDSNELHGTHTTGILAGYHPDSPYNGIAVKSDIVVATGDLYDAFLLNGCEEIITYAKRVGKPAVISMSISNFIGAHDGTSLFDQYINLLTDEAPVVLAVGNESPRLGTVQNYSIDTKPFRTYVLAGRERNNISANIDIWGRDETPLTLKLIRYNDNTQTRVAEITVPAIGESSEWIYVSDEYAEIYPWCEKTRLPDGLNGFIYVAAEVNPENNRYNITVMYRVAKMDRVELNPNEVFGLEVDPVDGGEVDVFSTGVYLRPLTDPEATQGTIDGTISTMCAGRKVIGVGAFVSKDYEPHLDGTQIPSYFKPLDAPASFSSYATALPNGRMLPDLCAPGSQIVSAFTTPFIETHADALDSFGAGQITVDGTTYYYMHTVGTSMSTPFVAGMAALLYQAVPDASAEAVRNALVLSAGAPLQDADNPQWGGGALDGAAALAMLQSMSGVNVENVSVDTKISMHIDENKHLRIAGLQFADATLCIYDMQGRVVAKFNVSDNCSVDLSMLPSAIYVAQVKADVKNFSTLKLAL